MAGETITECTVGDVAAPSRNALVGGPFGSDLVSRDYVPNGVPVIRGANMGHGRWVDGEFVYVTPEKADSLASNCAKPGDLVFTQRGTLGQVALVPMKGADRYLISQSQMKVTLDPTKADAIFLYYVFISPEQQAYIVQNAITTGVPHTNLGILRNTPLTLPPLAEQKAIAAVLGALDDKIELNRRMNATLEAMARALFQSWFVDFDPVRTKLDGRLPAALDSATATLFPDSFQDSSIGHIPTGWEVAELGQIADVIDCLHAKKPERCENGQLYLQLNNIRDDGLIDITDSFFISAEDYQKWISRMEARAGDCVITNVGRVGAVGQIPEGVKAALGRNITGIRCKSAFPFPTFLIECLVSESMREEIRLKTDSGTILDALNVKSIPKLRFVRPTPEIGARFEALARPLRRRMEQNLSESRTLATLRDTLLPKLLSGELSVAGLESKLKATA
ncbi:MAG: restriction endonuclease subunit S [Chromatiaceae bacterium]|nr:restriction endonuclease subunit S [Chromatiaceae bacterium]